MVGRPGRPMRRHARLARTGDSQRLPGDHPQRHHILAPPKQAIRLAQPAQPDGHPAPPGTERLKPWPTKESTDLKPYGAPTGTALPAPCSSSTVQNGSVTAHE